MKTCLVPKISQNTEPERTERNFSGWGKRDFSVLEKIMGNALPKNPFQKHQEKVVSEELIEENLDPKEFPQVFPPFFSFIQKTQRFIQHLKTEPQRTRSKWEEFNNAVGL